MLEDLSEAIGATRDPDAGRLDASLVRGLRSPGAYDDAVACLESLATAASREGKGGFNVTSTCEFSDEMCQRKCPLFENSTRDDLSSKTMSGN